jgi:hypothetical protein
VQIGRLVMKVEKVRPRGKQTRRTKLLWAGSSGVQQPADSSVNQHTSSSIIYDKLLQVYISYLTKRKNM